MTKVGHVVRALRGRETERNIGAHSWKTPMRVCVCTITEKEAKLRVSFVKVDSTVSNQSFQDLGVGGMTFMNGIQSCLRRIARIIRYSTFKERHPLLLKGGNQKKKRHHQ